MKLFDNSFPKAASVHGRSVYVGGHHRSIWFGPETKGQPAVPGKWNVDRPAARVTIGPGL